VTQAITARLPAAPGRTVAGVAAIMALDAAVLVLVFGVVVTSGVYGSRLAWLIGVALPLLATTMVLSRLSTYPPRQVRGNALPAPLARRHTLSRTVFLAALCLFAIPIVLALGLFTAYALVCALHGVSLLL
jgi:hypothetical protein